MENKKPMNNQLPRDYEASSRKHLSRFTAWAIGLSLVAVLVLPTTNRRGWTNTPLWAAPLYGAALVLYVFGTTSYVIRRDRVRAQKPSELFWRGSHIGANPENDYWCIHSLFAATACLIGGAITSKVVFSPLFPMVFIPLVVPSIMTLTNTGFRTGFDRILAVFIGMPGFQLLSFTFRRPHHALTSATVGFHVGVFMLGLAFIGIMLLWHAQFTWRESSRTESPTP